MTPRVRTSRKMNTKEEGLKIHIVTPHWAPFVGGAEVVAEETVALLAARHTVTVHTANLRRGWHRGREVSVSQFGGIRVVRYPTLGNTTLFKPDLRGADIIHIHGFYRPLILMCLAKLRAPIVIQPHGNLSPPRGGQGSVRRRLREVFDRKIFRIFASNVSGYICLSDFEIDRLVLMGANRLQCITLPGPIRQNLVQDAELLTVEAPAEHRDRDGDLFLVVCRVVPHKYIEHVLLAVARIPEVRVVIVGALADVGYVEFLHHMAKDLGVDKRVMFQGEIAPQELEILLCSAVGTVLASKTEGWPLSIAEAVLFGAIPIATKSAVEHVAKAMGLPLLYAWSDIEGLVNVMNRVRTDSDLADAVTASKEWVLRHLTPDVVVRILESFYHEVQACRLT